VVKSYICAENLFSLNFLFFWLVSLCTLTISFDDLAGKTFYSSVLPFEIYSFFIPVVYALIRGPA
jgi:hypothetical protein